MTPPYFPAIPDPMLLTDTALIWWATAQARCGRRLYCRPIPGGVFYDLYPGEFAAYIAAFRHPEQAEGITLAIVDPHPDDPQFSPKPIIPGGTPPA